MPKRSPNTSLANCVSRRNTRRIAIAGKADEVGAGLAALRRAHALDRRGDARRLVVEEHFGLGRVLFAL